MPKLPDWAIDLGHLRVLRFLRGIKARQINGLEILGGDEGDRTLDLRIANATLSQLSYVPTIV